MAALGRGARGDGVGPDGSHVGDGPRAHFHILADPDPQVPLRLLNYFAQRDCLPMSFSMTQANGALVMQILIRGIDEVTANLVAVKMRSTVLVRNVELSFANE
jgi:hypothetical protein